MPTILDLLKRHAGAFKKAEAPERGNLPDDMYQLEFTLLGGKSPVPSDPDSDGAYRARLGMTVVACSDEKLVGRKTSKSWTLIGKDGEPDMRSMGYLKADLTACGIQGTEEMDSTDLPEALKSLVGVIVNAQVKNTAKASGAGMNQNIYIRDLAAAATPAPKGKPGGKATGRRV